MNEREEKRMGSQQTAEQADTLNFGDPICVECRARLRVSTCFLAPGQKQFPSRKCTVCHQTQCCPKVAHWLTPLTSREQLRVGHYICKECSKSLIVELWGVETKVKVPCVKCGEPQVCRGVLKNQVERPSWDKYFMQIARDVAIRSTCLRPGRQIGAVIVKDKRLLTTGYNGAPRGVPHCSEVGCLRQRLDIPSGERHELCRGIHGEANAIIQAALHGVSTEGATLYCTNHPCSFCMKEIINAGIVRIVCEKDYPDELAKELAKEAGIKIIVLGGD